MAKERYYIIATQYILNKNILSKPVDYIYDQKLGPNKKLFVAPTADMVLEDFALISEEHARKIFDAFVGSSDPLSFMVDDKFYDHSPASLMADFGAFTERCSFQIDLQVSKIIENEDGEQADKQDIQICSKRIHAGFVVR